jgi:hypothetical protein
VRVLASILAMSVLVAGPAFADNDKVQRGPVPHWVVQSELLPVPDDASGLMFVRRQDVLVHFDGEGQDQYFGYRIKLLHPNALQLGNLQIAWNPAAGAPTVHVIRIHRDGAVIDLLESASFETLRREGQLDEAKLDGILTAVYRVADLRVGDELEVGVTTRQVDPTLGPKDGGMLMLGPEPPAGRFRLRLSWAEGQEPHFKVSPDLAAVARRGERAVEFDLDNPISVMPPRDAPPRYHWQRVVEYSGFADWPEISRRFAALFANAARLDADSPLKAEARRIAAAHASPLDRASAALKLVQQEVRYVYVGLNGGNLMPATADETWQRRYGDCKGKTALLLALLAELGIEAEAVLANQAGGDDGFDERLPSARLFDHVLVRARIEAAKYWLDGTLPPVVTPSATPILPYRWVLPLAAHGSSMEHLEWRPSGKPDEITLHEIDARAGFDEPARITSTTIVRGIAGVQQQVQLSAVTPAQLLNSVRQRAVGDTWQTIEDVQWRYDLKAQASVFTIIGTGKVDWNDDRDGAKSLTLPGGGFNPPERRIRAADQDQELPYYKEPSFNCHVTTVRLPEGTQATQWSFNSSYDTRIFGANYYRAFELRDGAIRMVRGFRLEQAEIDAATARRDNARIAAFDNSMARIHFDPTGKRSVEATTVPVPATDEIDWMADTVPCLSPAQQSSASPFDARIPHFAPAR